MGRIRKPGSTRKSRARFFIPSPDILHTGDQRHPKTSSRTAVIVAKLYAQELNITIPLATIEKVTGVRECNQQRILRSHQSRTLYNEPDAGSDPCGRKRGLMCNNTSAITDYLDDDSIPQDEKGKPWRDVARAAGIKLSTTTYFNPIEKHTIES